MHLGRDRSDQVSVGDSGIADNAQAGECVRTIAGWQPLLSARPRQKVSRVRRQPCG